MPIGRNHGSSATACSPCSHAACSAAQRLSRCCAIRIRFSDGLQRISSPPPYTAVRTSSSAGRWHTMAQTLGSHIRTSSRSARQPSSSPPHISSSSASSHGAMDVCTAKRSAPSARCSAPSAATPSCICISARTASRAASAPKAARRPASTSRIIALTPAAASTASPASQPAQKAHFPLAVRPWLPQPRRTDMPAKSPRIQRTPPPT